MAGETAIFGDVYLVGLEKVQPQICCPMPYVVSATSCIYRRQLASFDAKKCRKRIDGYTCAHYLRFYFDHSHKSFFLSFRASLLTKAQTFWLYTQNLASISYLLFVNM